jgi:type I restriction enzyme, R subunit
MSQSSNFSFLQEEWKDLWRIASEAEQHCLTIPRHTANLCRIGVEASIHWMYDNDEDLSIPYDKRLYSLMTQASFSSAA